MGVKRESFLFHIHLSVVSSFDMQGCAQAGVKMEKNERHEVPAEELDSLASRFLLIIPSAAKVTGPELVSSLRRPIGRT